MRRLRFTLAQLMVLVFFLGVCFAALANANRFWVSLTHTAAIMMISAAPIGAVARTGRDRLRWAGFALFGWTSFLLSSLPLHVYINGSTLTSSPPLLIAWGIDALSPYVTAGPFLSDSAIAFHEIGHSLEIILFGLIGAIIGGFLAVKPVQPNSSSPDSL